MSPNWTHPPSEQIQSLPRSPLLLSPAWISAASFPGYFCFLPSSPSVFQIQPQGCFEGKCQIMSLLCSEFPNGSQCHSSDVSSGVPRGPTGSSTYNLPEATSPTPTLASTLVHEFLVPPNIHFTLHSHCALTSAFSFFTIIMLGLTMAFVHMCLFPVSLAP